MCCGRWGPIRACPGQGGLPGWWPRPWALASGRPLLVSDPRQGWAFAACLFVGSSQRPPSGSINVEPRKQTRQPWGWHWGLEPAGGWEDVCPAPLLPFTEHSLCARPGAPPSPPDLSPPNCQPARPQQPSPWLFLCLGHPPQRLLGQRGCAILLPPQNPASPQSRGPVAPRSGASPAPAHVLLP